MKRRATCHPYKGRSYYRSMADLDDAYDIVKARQREAEAAKAAGATQQEQTDTQGEKKNG